MERMHRIRLAASALATLWALACGTAAAQAPPVERFTLANGLTVFVQPDRRAPVAVHMLWLRTGAIDEVDGTSGVAHVLEHMMFKGTPTVPAGQFSRRVAALGGRENAFTGGDYTGYYQQVPAGKLEDVMRLEADRFQNVQWADIEFTREIEVVKEERRLRTEDQPRALLYEQLMAAAFTASPERRPIVGWMSDLDAMVPADVRDFHRRWYVPANAAVVVAGDVDVQQVRRIAEATYGRIPAGAVPARKPRTEPPQRGMRRTTLRAPAEQAYVMLAFRAPRLATLDGAPDAEADDAIALTVLAGVLSGYPGARLDRALVRTAPRIADSASASYGLTGRGPQLFMLTGVPAAGQPSEALEAALRREVQRVATEGVGEAELARVKTQWVAQQVYARDSVFGQAQDIGSNWVLGLPPDADDRLIERLRAVTAQQVQSVAQRYFGDDTLTVATLRPDPAAPAPAPRPAAAAGATRH